MPERSKPWDYIVIGAGSAGCALAYELAKGNPGARILILEAGGSDRSLLIRLQAGVFRAMTRNDWGYSCQPDPTRNGLTERWIRGKVLGGTSSLNSAIYTRGAPADFDRWAQNLGGAAGASWSAQAVMPLFRELECSDQEGPLRGQRGQLRVRTVNRAHPITEAFIASASAVGHSFNPDYNGASQEGVSYGQLTQHKGFRCSAADAFLRPLMRSKNIELLMHAMAEKIEICNGRARAVSFRHGGIRREESAHRIILCAGSINSPKLLMLSGIGDRAELERHGIGVEMNLPGVGQNLLEHPLIKMTYRSRIETYTLTGGIRQKIGFAAQFLKSREGPIANVFESVAFIKTTSDEVYPDVQLHLTPVSWSGSDEGKLLFPPYPSLGVYINKSHSVSRGRMQLASREPSAAPRIECELLKDKSDLDTLVRGIEAVRRIMATAPIRDLLTEEIEPGAQFKSEAMLETHVRKHTTIANHSIGTCRMGTDVDAVVGPDLRVHGIENLWVADASVMPDHISGNTSATCMMIGKKLGKQFGTQAAN